MVKAELRRAGVDDALNGSANFLDQTKPYETILHHLQQERDALDEAEENSDESDDASGKGWMFKCVHRIILPIEVFIIQLLSYVGVLLLLALLFFIVIDFFPQLTLPQDPAQPDRGVCGYASTDGNTPARIVDLFSENLAFVWNGTTVYAHSDLPEECNQIYLTDVVNTTTGPGCIEWCVKVAGNSPHLGCMALNVPFSRAPVFRTCDKAHVWDQTHSIRAWMGIVVALSFTVVVTAIGYLKAIVIREAGEAHQATRPPLPNGHSDDFPFLGMFAPPLHCVPSPNDRVMAKTQLAIAFWGLSTDPASDLMSIVGLLRNGQPFYAMLLVAAYAMNPLPLQAMAAKNFFLCMFGRGFFNKFLFEHQLADGSTEGVWSCVISLFALMRTPALDTWTISALLFSCLSCVFLCIPFAAISWELLTMRADQLDLGNFYSVAQARHEVGVRRFLPSCEVVAFTVIFGASLEFGVGTQDMWSLYMLGNPWLGVPGVVNHYLIYPNFAGFKKLCLQCIVFATSVVLFMLLSKTSGLFKRGMTWRSLQTYIVPWFAWPLIPAWFPYHPLVHSFRATFHFPHRIFVYGVFWTCSIYAHAEDYVVCLRKGNKDTVILIIGWVAFILMVALYIHVRAGGFLFDAEKRAYALED